MCGHDGCLSSFTKWSEAVAHRKTEHKKISVCPDCGKSEFKSEATFRQHLSSHGSTENAPQICPKCGKDFLSRRSLKAHLMAVHETERPFSCPHCDMTYGYNKLLLKHIEKVHTQPAFIEDDQIPETIDPRLTEEFSLHTLVGLDYSAERELCCPVERCGRRFTRSYDLDRHLQSVHSVLEFIE